ncbi:delta12-fatty acid desaturase [Auricularia subglabra TFB-10046 SS5]|nr:delta12-fatty acid desaturase [Auricularia subglabra TFB-10046 SS5]
MAFDDAAPAPVFSDGGEVREKVDQVEFIVPGLTVKDLLSAIPPHCQKRSALRSSTYIVWDAALLYGFYWLAARASGWLTPEHVQLPHPALYTVGWLAIWALYSFAAGLVATGLWVIAHECGHQAFSESKFLNNVVGWVLHSGLGVPYHSWRITHAKHHASTGHLYQDQVYVPRSRSELGLPPFDPAGEDLLGSSVTEKVKAELWEALGDSPIGAALGAGSYLLFGWHAHIIFNASGQPYPSGTNHFNPRPPLYAPHQFWQIIASDIGVAIWLGAVVYWSWTRSFGEMMRIYGLPYLWVNHWLILITFLQHTDPLLPHYRPPMFTFARGALTTFDRSLLGGAGSFFGWLGACATHGISETHVLHHVSSKIPHYHAWEATYALRRRLESAGIKLIGAPGGWSEMYRVYRECKFVEDEGNVVFYKNAKGLAAARPIFPDGTISDSGVDVQ